MYWQVYLHKTVISAEFLLMKILKRAKFLAKNGSDVFCSPAFKLFLYNDISKEDFQSKKTLESFTQLDDYDVLGAIKVWSNHSDKVLAELCNMLVNRHLLKVQIQKEEFSKEEIEKHIQLASKHYAISEEEANYFVFNSNIENNAYNPEMDRINILFKDGSVMDITEASDNLNVQALSMTVRKHFLCYPSI